MKYRCVNNRVTIRGGSRSVNLTIDKLYVLHSIDPEGYFQMVDDQGILNEFYPERFVPAEYENVKDILERYDVCL